MVCVLVVDLRLGDANPSCSGGAAPGLGTVLTAGSSRTVTVFLQFDFRPGAQLVHLRFSLAHLHL